MRKKNLAILYKVGDYVTAAGVAHKSYPTVSVFGTTCTSGTSCTPTVPVANGGTGNAFFTVSGPASSAKTYTFPNANATMIQKIAGGTAALTSTHILGSVTTIAANTCSSAYTVAATGTLSTDVIVVTANANIAAITGYGAVSTDGLAIYWYPITDNIDWIVCNKTGTAIALTDTTYPSINYMVQR